MVEHAGADNLVERLAELLDLLDREPTEVEISKAVLSLKLARVTEACFADVDSGDMRIGLAHRMGRGLRGSTTGDQNLPPCPLNFRRPKQKRERSPSIGIPIELAMLVEVAQRRRIRVALVERPHFLGAIGGRRICRIFEIHKRRSPVAMARPAREARRSGTAKKANRSIKINETGSDHKNRRVHRLL